jgi:CheY-like chemotaxis protein/predicted DNA-binding protein YlxM (UPF0122 family)
MMTESLTNEDFEQELQNCLLHFYDYAYLQDNPVVKSLFPDVTTADRIQKFRDRITDAVERLRPPDSTPSLAKGARAYHVLTMRYIEQASIDEITEQMSISRRQFYRELSRAITSLVNILQDSLPTYHAEDDIFNLQSEIESLRQHTKRHVTTNLQDLLDGVIRANKILASNNGVMIQQTKQTSSTDVSLDQALLRQLMVVLISTIVRHYKHEGVLTLDYQVNKEHIIFNFSVTHREHAREIITILEDKSTIPALLKSIGGNLVLSADGNPCIQLIIPMRRATILIIDDNPDVIDLFRRLIDNTIYRVVVATDGTDIDDLTKQVAFDVIFLDIMLPRIDGFEILQTLKSNTTTQHIPVVICSVLDTEELALSLGADAVIAKPPSKSGLDAVLQRWI